MCRRRSQLPGSGRKTPPDFLVALSDVKKWSGGSLGYPGVVRRPFRMIESGWESLPNAREWTEGPPG